MDTALQNWENAGTWSPTSADLLEIKEVGAHLDRNADQVFVTAVRIAHSVEGGSLLQLSVDEQESRKSDDKDIDRITSASHEPDHSTRPIVSLKTNTDTWISATTLATQELRGVLPATSPIWQKLRHDANSWTMLSQLGS